MLFFIILAIIFVEALWEFVLGELNRKSWSDSVPERLKDVYPEDKFQKQKAYRIANYQFGLISSSVSTVAILAVLWFQGFAWIHNVVSYTTESWLWQPLLFFAIIGMASTILSLPFSVYDTFVIEERFGFNKTTPSVFVTDLLKSMLSGAIIGG